MLVEMTKAQSHDWKLDSVLKVVCQQCVTVEAELTRMELQYVNELPPLPHPRPQQVHSQQEGMARPATVDASTE